MRVKTQMKNRIKKVNKKAPKWQRNRMAEQSMRGTIINRAFDVAEQEQAAIAANQARR